ncbi:MAG: amidohydrolase family protein [Treponema sp.]|jgi:L-fuconolactonase|nr:amidohydrolase family protein [Treponema sp.]
MSKKLDFGIVDTHVHVWDVEKMRYPWLDDVPFLNRSFTLADYKDACGEVQVDKMVFVQCECDPAQHLNEVEWITAQAKTEPRLKGLVPWAPLEKGRAVEEELAVFAQNPLIKGIRRIIQFEPDMEFCLKPGFITGVNLLPKYHLTCDVCIDYRHNRNTLKFLEKVGDVPCILDHIGKPNIKGGGLDPWRSEIREMAQFPNLMCKVSSLATEADHKKWTIEDIRPYADTIFEAFGPDRVVFAGDWPVSSQAAAYPVCVSTILKLLKDVENDQLYKLFRKNAEDFYHI